MKQKYIVSIALEKGVEISQVQDWINEKIKDSKVTEIRLYNTELIFDGSLNTFLGDIDVLSPEEVSKKELTKLFKSHPYFIHQFILKNHTQEFEGVSMTEKTNLHATSKQPHIIDETELNQLIANFSKKDPVEIANESYDHICSDTLDSDECYKKNTRVKVPHNILLPHKLG